MLGILREVQPWVSLDAPEAEYPMSPTLLSNGEPPTFSFAALDNTLQASSRSGDVPPSSTGPASATSNVSSAPLVNTTQHRVHVPFSGAPLESLVGTTSPRSASPAVPDLPFSLANAPPMLQQHSWLASTSSGSPSTGSPVHHGITVAIPPSQLGAPSAATMQSAAGPATIAHLTLSRSGTPARGTPIERTSTGPSIASSLEASPGMPNAAGSGAGRSMFGLTRQTYAETTKLLGNDIIALLVAILDVHSAGKVRVVRPAGCCR